MIANEKPAQKKYLITSNIEDHTGYNNQPVWIIQTHKQDYHTVTDGNTKWYCGKEELTPID